MHVSGTDEAAHTPETIAFASRPANCGSSYGPGSEYQAQCWYDAMKLSHVPCLDSITVQVKVKMIDTPHLHHPGYRCRRNARARTHTHTHTHTLQHLSCETQTSHVHGETRSFVQHRTLPHSSTYVSVRSSTCLSSLIHLSVRPPTCLSSLIHVSVRPPTRLSCSSSPKTSTKCGDHCVTSFLEASRRTTIKPWVFTPCTFARAHNFFFSFVLFFTVKRMGSIDDATSLYKRDEYLVSGAKCSSPRILIAARVTPHYSLDSRLSRHSLRFPTHNISNYVNRTCVSRSHHSQTHATCRHSQKKKKKGTRTRSKILRTVALFLRAGGAKSAFGSRRATHLRKRLVLALPLAAYLHVACSGGGWRWW
jgi:hypothetical protein